MTHWWTAGRPEHFRFASWIWREEHLYPILAFLWPRNMTADKTKERNTHEPLMIYSWTTHKRGPLDTDSFIYSFIHSLWIKHSVGFLGFLRIPLDPSGFSDEHREGFQIHGYHEKSVYHLLVCADCLRISISRSFSVAPTHEKLMAPSWITHEGAEFLRFLKIPVDSSGLLRNSWRRLEDPRLSWILFAS